MQTSSSSSASCVAASASGAGQASRARTLLSLLLLPLRYSERLLVLLLLGLVRGYQRAISPLLRPCCRFVPSCSEYAAEALKRYGLIKGLGKTLYRLARCHPFCRGGYDAP